ncbi:DUF4406 domain-containing protein [Candidatus Uhrbacteria bacterium]|nr:DUF4406 domain-containing protein [Candidatus Uhrbacteria bacterium]
MHQYLNDGDEQAIENSQTFQDLLAIALRILERMPRPLVQVSGPITTGGTGSEEANSLRIHETRKALQDSGHHVFDYMIFQESLMRLRDACCTERYCMELMEIFFRGIFESGHISKVFFLPDWESSIGARWERQVVSEQGLEIIDIPSEGIAEDAEREVVKILESK